MSETIMDTTPEFRKARIRQANALAKSGQELDLNEKRLLLVAMARINASDTELLTHKILMSELETHLGPNPYARAEKAARGLLRRLVYVPTENGGFREFQWTTVAEYVPAKSSEVGESYVKIRLNEELAPLLLELRERYNTIPLLELLPMESFNGQRLYEILWHESHAGERKILTYNLQDLKFSLGMRTLEQKGSKKVWVEKYKAWRDFRKMLVRAQEEFEAHGRLRFSFDAIRQGRAISQVRFHLSVIAETDNANSALPLKAVRDISPQGQALAKQLADLGYLQDANDLVFEYGVDLVASAIKLGRAAEARAAGTSRPIKNLPGFILHLLTSGVALRSLNKKDETQRNSREAEQELFWALKTSYEAYQNEVASELFNSLEEDTKSALPEMLRVELETRNRSYLIDVLDKARWEGTQYVIARDEYLLDLYQDEVSESARSITAFVQERGLLVDQDQATAKRVLKLLQDELEPVP